VNTPGLIALTRDVSPALDRCELTHLQRVPIDVAKAAAQHREYERALEALGCRVLRLASGPDLPDSVFIEDTALVFDEVAVLTRPGAESRRVETAAVAEALRPHRRLLQLDAPGTLDGGDVLVVGRTVFVGLSLRTDATGADQLQALLAPFGYRVRCLVVRDCLHLKSAVTAVRDDLLLYNPDWVEARLLEGFGLLEVDPSEGSGANAVRVGGQLLYGAAFPKTRARLEACGLTVTPVDVSELAKAEGAVTCCSLIFRA